MAGRRSDSGGGQCGNTNTHKNEKQSREGRDMVRYIDTRTAAERLGVTQQTIRNWCRGWKRSQWRQVGQKIQVSADLVEALAAGKTSERSLTPQAVRSTAAVKADTQNFWKALKSAK